jgi:type IX secretion system PorP/SprF family membrane protein
MKLKLYALLAAGCLAFSSQAQDVHFSQFYAAPLTLNPASTGDFDGLFRVTGIYRNQWLGVANVKPFFSTPSVGLDFSLLRDKFEGTKMEGSSLGVGVSFTNDQQNDKTFSNNQFMVSVAYHQALLKKKLIIGLGFQGGMFLKQVNSNNFQFGSGFLPDLNYDQNLGETVNSPNVNRFDLNAGLNMTFKLVKNLDFTVGYAAMHLTRPKEAYLNSTSSNRLPVRHQISTMFDITAAKRLSLLPGFLYQNQAKAHEGTFGLTAGIHFVNKPDDRATLFLGIWSRLNTGVDKTLTSAIIPKAGIEFKKVRIGAAYDIGLGPIRKDVKAAATGRAPNAFEISFQYIFQNATPKEANWLFNPRY